jgi:hypothetical protein
MGVKEIKIKCKNKGYVGFDWVVPKVEVCLLNNEVENRHKIVITIIDNLDLHGL